FNSLAKEVTETLEKFELGIAVSKLYDFMWDVFCDWYIEIAKIRLWEKDSKGAENARKVCVFIMSNALILLHPFIPFITEEIWQTLPHEGESIMVADWFKYDESLNFEQDEQAMEHIINAIKAIRNRRAEMNVPPSKKAKVCIETAYADTFRMGEKIIMKLAYASEVEIGSNFELPNAVSVVTDSARIYIPMGDLVDFEAERARLNKEREAAMKDVEFIMSKLNNPSFVAKAPEKVVEGQRQALAKLQEKIALIDESLAKLN
ncbi:MAG: class I tRNA ligase family protein, partial [Clostridia bacterium]|nr:class I tRNA ligase family protein [Clostridia bacterium]